MAMPFDGATTFLTDGTDAVRQFYHEKFLDMHSRFGHPLNRLFKVSKRTINGDGVNVQVKDRNLYGARTNTDLNGDFPTPRAFGADTYKVTLSETPASNDIRRMALSLRVTHLDLKRKYAANVAAVDWAKELIKESMANIAESTALHRHIGADARIGTISGTATKNNTKLVSSAAAIAATGGARFVVANGSIAAFPRGLVLDVYTGSTYLRSVYVTDYNPRDKSVGVYGLDANGNPSSSVDVRTLTAADALYISGEYNAGMKCMGYWFSTPTASESFFGRDRTDADSRWLEPHVSGPTSSTVFQKSHLDNLSNEMGYISEDEDSGGYVVITTPEMDQKYRDIVGNDVVIQVPTSEQKGKLIASYGFDGMLYRHPTMGRIVFQPDPMAPPNTIRGLRIGDWETFYAPGAAWEWLVGDTADGWYRESSTTPGGGKTTTYRMDGMGAWADLCLLPRLQWHIANVTAS